MSFIREQLEQKLLKSQENTSENIFSSAYFSTKLSCVEQNMQFSTIQNEKGLL